MSRDWEAQLLVWSKPPGTPEQAKMETAESDIREAISKHTAMAARNVEVFPQGSYRNRTNIPTESDVDICVVSRDVLFSDWYHVDQPGPKTPEVRKALEREAGLIDAPYAYADFKNDVGGALVAHFGEAAVERGDKAFDVHETRRWVDSDVVAAFEHRSWFRKPSGALDYAVGTQFITDSGNRIENFPQQHYDCGVAKNAATGKRFKAMARGSRPGSAVKALTAWAPRHG